MLIINECTKCNADKATCPIRTELQKKLTGIKERLKYKCTGWQQHLKYKVGDKIEFHFIENAVESKKGWALSGETLVGIVIGISKKRPVYYVTIDKENRNKIDPEFAYYDKHVTPHDYTDPDPVEFDVPVKEEFILGIVE